MATTITDETLRIARLAMYQLRQDVGVPESTSAAASDTSPEWQKCKAYIDIAFNEVLMAHNWTWKRTGSAVADYSTKPDNWPVDAKNALVYCLARELAVPIAGRTEDMKNCAALYQQKLIAARLTDLTDELANNNDSVLAQLVANFKADDPALINAFTVYTARKSAVMTECENAAKKDFEVTTLSDVPLVAAKCLAVARLAPACGLDSNFVQTQLALYDKMLGEHKQRKLATEADNETSELYTNCLAEVKQTLGISSGTVDGLVKAATKCLCYARNGARYGYDANFIQLKEQEYAAKILQWRKVTLDTARADDAVLSQLVGAFKGDDTSLCNSWAMYQSRKAAVVTLCENAAKKDFEATTLSDVSQLAANCLAVAKLAPAFGLDVSFVQTQLALYDKLLSEYKQRKLATDIETTTSSVYTSCLAEVKKTLGVTGTTTDDLMTAAAKCLCYARNGARYGYDANFIQLKEQEYAAKILQWRKVTLDTARADDAVLSQLVGAFKGDDASLCNSWTMYQARKAAVVTLCDNAVKEDFGVTTLSGVPQLASNCLAVAKLAPAFGLDASYVQTQLALYDKMLNEYKQRKLATDADDVTSDIFTSCLAEVKHTLGVTSSLWDDLMEACAKCLCYTRYGARYGYDANFIQLKEQEYAAKILQWRKVALDDELKSNTDIVLSQLLANFKGEDSGLVNAFSIYTQRHTNIKALAETEINREQEWRTAFDYDAQTASSHPAYAAWVALCVSKLALACGMDANAASLLEKKYQQELQAAKVTDLEAAQTALTDTDTKEVLSVILANFSVEDSRLPRSLTDITRRIDARKVHARNEVMEAHNWSFARDEYMTGGCTCSPMPGPYAWSTPLPPKCARPLLCRGLDGRSVDWKVDGLSVLSDAPIMTITYLKNIDTVDRWPSVLRSAYVLLLAADVAAMTTGSSGEAQRLRTMYEKRLADAKLYDAAASGMRHACRGGNHYVEAMRGGSRPSVGLIDDVLRR